MTLFETDALNHFLSFDKISRPVTSINKVMRLISSCASVPHPPHDILLEDSV